MMSLEEPVFKEDPAAQEPDAAGAQGAYDDGTPEPLRLLEKILKEASEQVSREHAVPTPESDPDDPTF